MWRLRTDFGEVAKQLLPESTIVAPLSIEQRADLAVKIHQKDILGLNRSLPRFSRIVCSDLTNPVAISYFTALT
jgi:hypothetical protein